jgi:hypothetical protein
VHLLSFFIRRINSQRLARLLPSLHDHRIGSLLRRLLNMPLLHLAAKPHLARVSMRGKQCAAAAQRSAQSGSE